MSLLQMSIQGGALIFGSGALGCEKPAAETYLLGAVVDGVRAAADPALGTVPIQRV